MITFKTTLTESDWDKRLGGWKCEALAIPGAKLFELYSAGRNIDTRFFQTSSTGVLWSGGTRPREVLATIVLEKDLTEIERERFGLEKDKLELEQQKFISEKRWKIYAAAGAALSALLTFTTTNQIIPRFTAPNGLNPSNNIGLLGYFDQSNDFLASGGANHYQFLLDHTKHEAWFFGISFYISVEQYREILLKKVRSGVELNFLILDPNSSALARAAQVLGSSEQEIRNQCYSGLKSLQVLAQAARSGEGDLGKVNVKLMPEPPVSRIYFFDPKSDDGVTYYVPQVNRMNTQSLPGFLVLNKSAKIHDFYFAGIQKVWADPNTLWLKDWLEKNPAFLSSSTGTTSH